MLTLDYRPKKLEDLIGQPHIQQICRGIFKKYKETGYLPTCILLGGPWGSGKCVVGSTLIKTDNGIRKIQDIVPSDSIGFKNIPQFNVYVNGVEKKVNEGYYSGKTKTIRIETERGKIIEGTYDHPLMVWRKTTGFTWVKLKNIKEGDTLVEELTPVSFIDESKLKTNLSDYLYFCGLLIGDANLSIKKNFKRVSFTTIEEPLIKWVKSYLKKFNVKYTVHIDNRRNIPATSIIFSGNNYLINRLYESGCIGKKSWEKTVPNEFWTASFEEQLSFVQGIMDTDGTKGCLEVGMCSKEVIYTINAVINALGISTKIVTKTPKRYGNANLNYTFYRLMIKPSTTGLYGKYLCRLKRKKIYTYNEKNFYQTNRIHFDYLGNYLISTSVKNGIDRNEIISKIESKHLRTKIRTGKNISNVYYIEMIQKAIKECGGDTLYKKIWFPDKVKTISKGNDDTYDIVVPDGHAFVANSLLSHNTSTARIIARYINCENDVENACGKCASCKAMNKDANPSVIEIDAASNRGIDNMRELQDSLKFTTPFRKKVIIIDECHQLSKEAVQSMLKTFEESKDALFIMCTTEVDSVLDTIKSRSIQMIVNNIPESDLGERLAYIADKEQINISNKAISMIASLSDGHARDALQLLETARYYEPDKQIKVKHIFECAGYADDYIANTIIDKFLSNDTSIIDTFKEVKESPVKVIKTILRILQNEINYHCADNKKQSSFSDASIKELIDLDHLFHSAHYYFKLNTGWSIYVLYHYFLCWKEKDFDSIPRIK